MNWIPSVKKLENLRRRGCPERSRPDLLMLTHQANLCGAFVTMVNEVRHQVFGIALLTDKEIRSTVAADPQPIQPAGNVLRERTLFEGVR
jgi:hypothetical protein